MHHCNSWIIEQLDITCYFISVLRAQHLSDINISIIRSLRLCCWITISVVLFLVRCMLEIWCGWFWMVSVLQAEASAYNTGTTQTQPHQISNIQRTKNKKTDMVIQQHSRKLLMMDILISETWWVHKKWNKIASDIKLVFYSSTIIFNPTAFHVQVCFQYLALLVAINILQISVFPLSHFRLVISAANYRCFIFVFPTS